MKKLYEFKLAKRETVTEKETTTNDNGEKITIEKEIEKPVDHHFFIRKPTRSLYDDAELFYGVELSKGIKAGLLTKALLSKRYENDGGSLSDTEIERFGNLYLDFYKNTDDYQRLLMENTEGEASDEDKTKLNSLEAEMKETRGMLTQFEMEQQSLYEQTAEVRARNKTILWWILQLSHSTTSEGDKEDSYFAGENFEQQLEQYDLKTELEDEFVTMVIQRFTYFVSFWFVGRASSQAEFDEMLKEQGLVPEVDLDGVVKEAMEANKEAEDLGLAEEEAVVNDDPPKEEENQEKEVAEEQKENDDDEIKIEKIVVKEDGKSDE
jgi:hypothetical protein